MAGSKQLVFLFVSLVFFISLSLSLPVTTSGRKAKCEMKTDTYPPPANHSIPIVRINLDLKPEERWAEICSAKAGEIKEMIDSVFGIFPKKMVDFLLERVDKRGDEILNAFPDEYGAEIRGIAKVTGIDVGLMIIYNIFYEVFGLCTSVVAEGPEGQQYHGRNLDFGLFLGVNMTEKTWSLPDKLRPLLFQAEFMRNGSVLYRSVQYAGYIGLLTGVKGGAFSVSVDSRFDLLFDHGLVAWLKGDHERNFLTFLTRSVMEKNATYAQAIETLSTSKMVGPSYIIVGGASPGDGAVITREENKLLDVWTIKDREKENRYYVLETNYDHWKQDPFFDDRRDPANACMDQLGRNGTNVASLFNVLSAHPNLNQLTTFTAVMEIQSGKIEAYLQWCPHPCPIW